MIKPVEKEAVQRNQSALVVGGGPVGLMLALGLAQQNIQVTLVEKVNLDETQENTSFDGRVLALSYGSMLAMQQLGIWQKLQPFTTEIHSVHVSQKGYLGVTHLHAEEMQVPALGYSITSQDLGQVLWQAVKKQEKIDLVCPAELIAFTQDNEQVEAQIQQADNRKTLKVDLLVGADGTQSKVRQLLDLPLETKDYDAFGIITRITSAETHQNWAFERFTLEGPVALLPMGEFDSKAVLVCPKEQVEDYLAMSDDAFIEAYTHKMGERFGGFTAVTERMAYPLKETYVPQMTKGRVVLMGNASHTQHPVAAQGLNLGIADIASFLNAITSAEDIGQAELLQTYAEQRHQHHKKVMGMTDGLIELFQTPSPVVGHLRGIGLMAMQAFKPLRKRFSRMSMGMEQ